MTPREDTPDLYVLDTLADDVEELSSILRSLNSDSAIGWHRIWGRHFRREEVVQALSRLIRADSVRVAVLTPDGKSLAEVQPRQIPPASYDDAWFSMTARGRLLHSNWNPGVPTDSE